MPDVPDAIPTDHDRKLAAWHDLQARADRPREGDTYRHYKGGLYDVIAVGIKEDTLEPMIAYWSRTYRTTMFRTLANFEEPVEVDGRTVPRFRREET